ncbi:hypothetical protein [uncultured Roseobacter sp.]|uniref:hypothetical protein n=1 Tax=uncultured Roseobacter sp. TaxID=114847 RepID=UPI00260C8273|nr:hypothetical protein [uncultured Roseobacter sp.]
MRHSRQAHSAPAQKRATGPAPGRASPDRSLSALSQRAAQSPAALRAGALQKSAAAAVLQRAVVQFQQTKVCLSSASGTYTLNGVAGTFAFQQGSKGSDVMVRTKSHPKSQQDKEALAQTYLIRQKYIPRGATNIAFTECSTYGIKV